MKEDEKEREMDVKVKEVKVKEEKERKEDEVGFRRNRKKRLCGKCVTTQRRGRHGGNLVPFCHFTRQ